MGGTEQPIGKVLAALGDRVVRQHGKEWQCRCPAHEDNRASLCVGVTTEGNVVLKCQAGCDTRDIVARLNLSMRDLFAGVTGTKPEISKAYDYRDADGNLLYQAVRYIPKDFRQRAPKAGGGWTWSTKGIKRVPYRLPELLAADTDKTVVVVEGEKDADRLASLGLVATCNVGGAGKWQETYGQWLEGRKVAILPDNDEPGRQHAQQVARSLYGTAASVRVVELPDLPEKGDVSDWLDKGGTPAQLAQLIGQATEWDPSVSFVSSPEGQPREIRWQEPRDLPADLPPVAAFDYELLPGPLRGWVRDISERVQCPPDYAAVAATVVLAGLVGRRVGIRPKVHDDWTVASNLWGAAIGRPGLMKSPAMAEPLKILKRLEIESKQDFEDALRRYEADKFIAAQSRRVVEKKIQDAIRKGGNPQALAEELFSTEPEAPTRRRYLVNSCTVEKLGMILNENPNGVVVFRDELTGLLRGLDKEGQEEARAFYLEAWNGVGRFTYDRVGRGTLDIEASIVSLLGGIQPGPLRAYLTEAVRSGRGDDGLLQRFQLAVWPDPPRTWKNVDRWPSKEWKTRAYETYRRVANIAPEDCGAELDQEDPERIPYLRFAPEAQAVFDQWRAALEHRLRLDDEHEAMESHLSKYRSLIPSLALLIHLADVGHGPVTAAALSRAIRWGEYLETHARRIFTVSTNPELASGRALANRIRRGDVKDGFALRDVYRNGWADLSTREEAARAVDLLVDLNWLAIEEERTDGRTRRAHRIHPRILETRAEGTDKTDRRVETVPETPHEGAFVSSVSSSQAHPGDFEDDWGDI